MNAPEFSHCVPLDRLRKQGEIFRLEAGALAREALARRFGLVALPRLAAELLVRRTAGGAQAEGHFEAEAVLACVLTGEPVTVQVDEPVRLRFAASGAEAGDEVELSAEDLDTLVIEEGMIDLGEAVAQSLALALPAYPRRSGAAVPGVSSEEAEVERRVAASPFAGLRRP